MAWPASSPGGRPAVPAHVPRGRAWASPLAPRPPLPSPSVTPALRPPPTGRPGPLRPEGVHLWCPHTAAGRVHVCAAVFPGVGRWCVCVLACSLPRARTRTCRAAQQPPPGLRGAPSRASLAHRRALSQAPGARGGAQLQRQPRSGEQRGGGWGGRHSPRLLGLGPGAGPVSHIVTTFEGAPVQSWGAHPVTLAASVQVPGGSRCGQNLGVLAGRPVLRSGQNCAWCWGWRAPLPRPAWQCPGHPAPLRETVGLLSPAPRAGLFSPCEVATHRRTSGAQGSRGASARATTRRLQLGDKRAPCLGTRSA